MHFSRQLGGPNDIMNYGVTGSVGNAKWFILFKDQCFTVILVEEIECQNNGKMALFSQNEPDIHYEFVNYKNLRWLK